MVRAKRYMQWAALAAVLLSLVLAARAETIAEGQNSTALQAEPTEISVAEQAQDLLTQGKSAEAAKFLGDRLRKFKGSDLLLSLHGRALMLLGKVEEAGDSFRKALEINPNSEAAKRYLEEVERTAHLMEGGSKQKLVEQILSNVNDKILYIVFGSLAAIFSLFYKTFMLTAKRRQFVRSLRRQDYHQVADALAFMLKHLRKAQLKQSLTNMLEVMSPPEVEKVIIDYVDDQKVEDDLLYVFRKMVQKA